MSASDARERAILDGQFGSGTPATWYVGLSTTAANDDGSGFTEPVGGAYARVAKTNNTTNFPAAATVGGVSSKSNGTAVGWADPTSNWGTLIWYGMFTAASGGTPEYAFPLDTGITAQSGNSPVEIGVGDLSLTCD
ncbi:MAG: hypothetical protein L0H84_08270 [Pseudonocardia sp.]|nr:hypothetical protein [Pseudonocardia sp.]